MAGNAVVTGWPSGSTNAGWPATPTAMLMPGRVQGWPAGTQRAANRAEQLLSQAVAYWDVAQYRDGDRFLRNRGTGGELLDLRLGSAIAANSNDPLFLDVARVGYVYLTGVAGNSLSMTAPATATQFIAYPLDRSVATTTGAATGGATFTFSTTGSWRSIELLDVSNVVLDTIDCDVITSGSATSFLSTGNQTVTVNRSTTGRKTVCVPSRANKGAPVMLFGTDDYLEVLDNWQHGLLNFGQGDSFTVVGVARRTGTLANFNTLIAKKASLGSDASAGYGLRLNADGIAYAYLADGTSFATATSTPAVTVNTLATFAFVKSGQRSRHYSNAASGTEITTSIGNLSSTLNLRVGREGVSTNYADMEFYAAAIFRRALSADEITRISNYFTARIA